MDRITDSGSVGCGSIPHGATVNPPVAEATAPKGMPTRFACRDGVIYTNGRASGSIRDAREERSAA